MQHHTSVEGGVPVLSVAGELDCVTVSALRGVVEGLLAESHERIIVDLSALRLIDSTGVGLIVSFYRRMLEQGRQLSVRQAAGQPLEILRLLRLDDRLLGVLEETPPLVPPAPTRMQGG